MRRATSVILLLAIGYLALNEFDFVDRLSTGSSPSSSVIVDAFINRKSDLQVSGTGEVTRVLSDDNDGSRHQRFILRISSGQTLLIAHNIDLAPRVPRLVKGDMVEFYGEYEWNDRGGVIHWTHQDPQGRHVDGWLKHRGRTYQ